MSGHTPGPWTLHEYDDGIIDVDADSWGSLAEVYLTHDRDDEGRANARLIAAAPDLLEALERFVSEYVEVVNSGDCGHWDPEEEDKVKEARAALASAKGGG